MLRNAQLLSATAALAVCIALSEPSRAQCNGPDDAFEDHDTCATALAVSLPFVQPALWVHRHDPDLFQVTVPAGFELRAALQCVDDQGDVDLVIYEPGPACGDLWVNFRSSRTSTDYEGINWLNDTGAPKVFIVQVEMWRGSIPICNQYNLSLTAVVPAPTCDPNVFDDQLEENDSCATARPLPLGSTPNLWVSHADGDHYSMRVPAGATLDVRIDFVHNTADLDLWLYEAGQACGTGTGELNRSISLTDTERIVWQNNSGAPRDVVVDVDVYSSSACNHYALVASVGGAGLGTNYCTATPNFTGVAGRMSARGSNQLAANNVTLEARQLTPNSMGSFVCSLDRGWTPAVGGGIGALCLGGNVGRFDTFVLPTGSLGQIELQINLTQLPQSGGSVSVAVGESWCFQAWYRDRLGNQPTSNLTDGLEVTFQ
jgi:hypothetical protein